MKKYPVSVQLYSVRDQAAKDFAGVLKKIASFGYTGVEFAGLHNLTPKEVRNIIDDLGLVASSTHGPMPDRGNLTEIVDAAHVLGYDCHISGCGPDDFKDVETSKRTGARFQEASQLLKAQGLRFGVHNHWWEFNKNFKGKLPYDIALEAAPGALCEIDTYWVKFGGPDPANLIKRFSSRTNFLHIKDGPLQKDKAMTAVGQGRMNWKPIMEAASASAAEWLVVELDSCDTDMLEAVQQSIQYLVEQGYGKAK